MPFVKLALKAWLDAGPSICKVSLVGKCGRWRALHYIRFGGALVLPVSPLGTAMEAKTAFL